MADGPWLIAIGQNAVTLSPKPFAISYVTCPPWTWRMTWYDPCHDYHHGSGWTPCDSKRHSTRGSAGPRNSARGALARRRDRDRTAAAAGQVRTQAPPSDCAADGQ